MWPPMGVMGRYPMAEQTLRMPIQGMTCQHCEQTIEATLAGTGAKGIKADFRRGEATFTVREGTDLPKLAAAVARAGYRPGEVESPEPIRRPTTPGAAG